jgi:membrane associated rhomboid family serine protease
MTFAPVGIRCPDHAAVGAPRGGAGRTIRTARHRAGTLDAPATMVLLGINVLVYLVTVYQGFGLNDPRGGSVYERGKLVGIDLYHGELVGVSQGEWWRLATAMFLHGSMLHLAFNMLALYWLGTIVEQSLGTWRYVLVYVASGLAGSAGALLLTEPGRSVVGASGAIFGIMGALLILEYLTTGSLAGQAMTLIVLNLALTFAIPNISIGGHLGGLVGGIAATYALARTRYVRPAAIGPALVVAVGIASIVVAYIRVESYTF